MELKRNQWGEVNGIPVEKFTLKDINSGFVVELTNFGAIIVRVKMPDKNGTTDDISFGCDNPQEYFQHPAYYGTIVGRVANRIAHGKFTLKGKNYQVAKNLADLHHLHGGDIGFSSKVWSLQNIDETEDETSIEFEYVSPDGEENYPGTLSVRVKYHISPMRLGWEIVATTDKTTLVNLTQHAYWNLEGQGTTIDNLNLKLFTDRYMPADQDDLVTGEVLPVERTPLECHHGKHLKNFFSEFGDIDHGFFVEDYQKSDRSQLNKCAELYSKKTGRYMEILTNQPIIHIYTGNYMKGLTSYGKLCSKHAALCFETQQPSNAINIPEFANSVILSPSEVYLHKTEHIFKINP